MIGKTKAVQIRNQVRNGKKIPHADCLSRVPTTTEEMVNQTGKTTDVSNNIWKQALKIPNLELQTIQLKYYERKTARSWMQNKERPEKKQMSGFSKTFRKI